MQAETGEDGRRPRVTIRQVAEQAGVSIATVSRVVNGRSDVSSETREAVSWVLREQGYPGSPRARAGRNGDGPNNMQAFAAAPYNQPASVISTLASGNWCNPPGAGLGLRPTANTGVPLLDAYLWVKIPGESDGQCDAAGGVRAWDYTAYTQPGWPTTAAQQALFDPLWGLNDPSAGSWFSQQALQLAQDANPSIAHASVPR